MRKARSYVSLALDARNAASHFDGMMQDREALRYLDAIRELIPWHSGTYRMKVQGGDTLPVARRRATELKDVLQG